MPGHDGTGPVQGGGPRMGRGLGPCGVGAGYCRRSRGNGRFGFDRRSQISTAYNQPGNWTKEDELKAMSEEQKMLKDELLSIEKGMANLKKSAA